MDEPDFRRKEFIEMDKAIEEFKKSLHEVLWPIIEPIANRFVKFINYFKRK